MTVIVFINDLVLLWMQAIIEKASIDEVYMDVTTMVEKELRVSWQL